MHGRSLIVALGVVVTLVVAAGAGLAASLSNGPSPHPPTPAGPVRAAGPAGHRTGTSGNGRTAGPGDTRPGPRRGTGTVPGANPTTTTPVNPTTTTPVNPTTTTPVNPTTATIPATTATAPTATPAPGIAPVITGLDPATGAPGQAIEVAGANFLSTDGQIVVTFDGRVVPTSCSTQHACTVTVPPPTGSATAQVTMTTASGTSNAVTFTYS